jgi:hypothetical protein
VDVLEERLVDEPATESKSRIKRLRGISDPDFRGSGGRGRIYKGGGRAEEGVAEEGVRKGSGGRAEEGVASINISIAAWMGAE